MTICHTLAKICLVAFSATFVAAAGTASAATVGTIDVTYVVSYAPTKDGSNHSEGNGPGMTGDIGTWTSGTHTGVVAEAFGASGGTKSDTNFLTLSPNGSCGSYCVSYTAYGTISVAFTFFDEGTGVTKYWTETGAYAARYSGTRLSCASTNSPASGETDCIDWSGAGTSPTGSVSDTITLGSDTLVVTLYNAEDWNLYPGISLQLTDGQTPLPAALPLFAGGLGVMGGVLGWRNKKRKAAVAA
jgi:hypothetical protein